MFGELEKTGMGRETWNDRELTMTTLNWQRERIKHSLFDVIDASLNTLRGGWIDWKEKIKQLFLY